MSAIKGRSGWQVTTKVRLGNNYELEILTMKRYNGHLLTTAQVGKREGMFVSHTVHQDFYKALVKTVPKRITQKVVEEQHNSVDVDSIIAEAKKFYKLEQQPVEA